MFKNLIYTLFVVCIFNYAKLSVSVGTSDDVTTVCLASINSLRVQGVTDYLPFLTAKKEAQEAVTSFVDGTVLAGASCTDPTADDYPTDYDRNWYKAESSLHDVTCSQASWQWFLEIEEYKCVYPPKENESPGNSVRSFGNMVGDDVVGLGCAKTKGCTQEILVCYFYPKAEKVRDEPVTADQFKDLSEGHDICSGSYYGKFAGIITTFLSITLAWTYLSA